MKATEGTPTLIFRDRLKRLRKEHLLTQEETAAQLGIPRTTYSGYEKCIREAGYEVLTKLAVLFNVSIDYLLGLTDQPNCVSERNACTFLHKEGLHWNGIPLKESEIKPIRELLKTLVETRTRL
ncbi:MAG TPA: helix-turn-helix transcriptional regulator [Sporolactobacillaceae bacterium]|nr:helix-turn-helix transcriptional regulator [Sporolactobacillaceae bacterium]